MSTTRIEEEAAHWLIELDTAPQVGTARWNDFEAWIQKDPQHRATFVKMEQAWKALDELADYMKSHNAPADRLASLGLWLQRLRAHPRFKAAALIVVAGVVWFVYG